MKYLLLFGVVITFLSCAKKQQQVCCTGPIKASVLSVTMPASLAIGNTATIDIKYGLSNGCEEFKQLNKSTIADTTFITMEAFSCGCVCTDIYRTPTYSYSFAPNQIGVHVFKFAASNNTIIEKRITVF
jgi:hypothetical protein